jgi:Acetyltransferases, including N-acetylases of ribosomal proteins
MLKTSRLLLRQWCAADLEPFAEMNADVRVREYFPGLLSREESDASVKIMTTHIEKNGWGFWAAELQETQEFIGFIGLQTVPYTAQFTPAVEIGWRLAYKYWGKGYATEGAKAALSFGLNTLDLKEIVALTVPNNFRSRHVMEKIGMQRNPEDDFDHPYVVDGNPCKRHVLYRASQANLC